MCSGTMKIMELEEKMSNELLWLFFILVQFGLLVLTYKFFGLTGLYVWIGFAIVAANIQEGQTLTTLQGEDLVFTLGGGVKVIDATSSEARVLTSDINTSNGILHLLDKVLLPQEVQNLFLNEGL